jgi:superfamily II DNA helicase RecQ
MGDDFEFSSDDEAEMLAATDDVVNGKRSNSNGQDTTAHAQKRTKTNDGTSIAISPSTVLANNVLKSRFGLNGFRLEQEAAITRILDGGSAVVVFPTGGGKSLCYQVSSCIRKSAALLLI